MSRLRRHSTGSSSTVADARDLRQRHHGALARVEIDVLQRVEIETLGRHGTGDDVDQVFALAQMRQRRAVHHGLRDERHVGRRQAERTGLVLVEVDLQRANRVVPVELDVAHLRAGGDDVFYLARDLAHLLRVRTDDTELDREADRRTELEARDADPHLRELLVDARHQPRAHAFARLHVLRHHDEDGVARVRQLRIEREIEARLAGAGVRGEEADVLILPEDRLHLLDLLGGRCERGAFLQAQLDDEFGPRTVGEELLRHEPLAKIAKASAATVTPMTHQRRSMARSIQRRSFR